MYDVIFTAVSITLEVIIPLLLITLLNCKVYRHMRRRKKRSSAVFSLVQHTLPSCNLVARIKIPQDLTTEECQGRKEISKGHGQGQIKHNHNKDDKGHKQSRENGAHDVTSVIMGEGQDGTGEGEGSAATGRVGVRTRRSGLLAMMLHVTQQGRGHGGRVTPTSQPIISSVSGSLDEDCDVIPPAPHGIDNPAYIPDLELSTVLRSEITQEQLVLGVTESARDLVARSKVTQGDIMARSEMTQGDVTIKSRTLIIHPTPGASGHTPGAQATFTQPGRSGHVTLTHPRGSDLSVATLSNISSTVDINDDYMECVDLTHSERMPENGVEATDKHGVINVEAAKTTSNRVDGITDNTVNTRPSSKDGSMLGRRRRQWTNIAPTLDEGLMVAGNDQQINNGVTNVEAAKSSSDTDKRVNGNTHGSNNTSDRDQVKSYCADHDQVKSLSESLRLDDIHDSDVIRLDDEKVTAVPKMRRSQGLHKPTVAFTTQPIGQPSGKSPGNIR